MRASPENVGYFFILVRKKNDFCAVQAFPPEMFLCVSVCVILCACAIVYVMFGDSGLRCR